MGNVDSPTRFIDMSIPCNLKSQHSMGLMWWFLAREVLRLRGTISRELTWEVMPDLFFYRDPEEAEEEGGGDMAQDGANEAVAPAPMAGAVAPPQGSVAPKYQVTEDWNPQSDWAAESAHAPDTAPATTQQWGGGSTSWN